MHMNLHKRVHTKDVQHMTPGEEVVLAGWAQVVKSLGKIAFIHLRDREGIVQVTIPQEFAKFAEVEKITQESVLAIKGIVQASKLKAGGNEVLIHEFEVLSPSEPGLPIDVTGKTPAGLDTRLDFRFLDLRNPKQLAIFKVRSMVNTAIREFLYKDGFIEMQTPKLISAGAEGGATLFEVKYYDRKAYLSQSQQLYKQMMLIAGFEKIFEIGPSFRAEKSHTMRHQTEFTQLDFEMAFINDEDDVLKVLERMFVYVAETVKSRCAEQLQIIGTEIDVPRLPFPRVTYKESLELLKTKGRDLKFGDDIGQEDEKLVGDLVKEKYDADAYFLTKWPYDQKPFYIKTDGEVSRGFDFEYLGTELVSGGQREHRYEVLREQIAGKGLKVADFDFYLTPFKYGAPPHGGFGMGIDRLTMKLLKLQNVREAILFPRDPERLVP
jgi:aspartyl-tRNA synthetase